MERFEEWLKEQDISVIGQYSTGSADMLRYRLRLLDGHEFEVALKGETLLERPEECIEQVRQAIDARRGAGSNGNGSHA